MRKFSCEYFFCDFFQENEASGKFYIDDFVSFNYSRRHDYFYYNLNYNSDTLNLT